MVERKIEHIVWPTTMVLDYPYFELDFRNSWICLTGSSPVSGIGKRSSYFTLFRCYTSRLTWKILN